MAMMEVSEEERRLEEEFKKWTATIETKTFTADTVLDEGAPEDIPGYIKWLDKEHNVKISTLTRSRYESVSSKIKTDFESSEIWNKLLGNLERYDQEYELTHGYKLLLSYEKPKLLIKKYDSFLLKTFRKNIIENSNFPGEPEDGWIIPDNWFTKINDIVRTLFVVKYIDGVEFFSNKIKELSSEWDIDYNLQLEAKEEGYYAGHNYLIREFEIPLETWETEKEEIKIEIQVTTQLQELIRKLLHKYYERKRSTLEKADIKWQWNYHSDEFSANYLGHILHYVEGMIMEIREKQKRDVK